MLVPGQITGIRYFRANANGTYSTATSRTVALYLADGTLLASKVTSGESQSEGWMLGTFTTPVQVVAGTQYVAAWWTDFSATGNTNYSNAVPTHVTLLSNCFVRSSVPVFPPDTTFAYNMGTDVNFQPATGYSWPIALKSG
jgi:hypothetical protein